jgi:RimJ/RimL family protein N-acetyltransferase
MSAAGRPFAFPEVVEAEGFRLRVPRLDDAPQVQRALDDELSRCFLPSVPEPMTLSYAEFWCVGGARERRDAGGVRYVIAGSATDEVLGAVSLQRVQPDRAQAEIGYWVAPWARGNGLAVRAVRAMAQAAFAAGLGRIELCAEWENTISQRVALAAGFRREGVRRAAAQRELDGKTIRYDLVVFARVISDPGEPVPRILPDLPDGRLTDGEIILRPLQPADAEDVFQLLQLPEVAAVNFGASTRAEIADKCAKAAALWLAGERADFVILDAATGAFAGDIGFWYIARVLQEGMLGYSLRPEFRGRGIAGRAVNLLARWAFEEVGVARLVAGTDPGNIASQKVLQRAGFEQEAYMRNRLPGPDGGRADDIQWVRLS